MEATVINITRYCTDDGPGIRTTVFLKGCPLRCIWCHNPESQNPQIEYYLSGEAKGYIVTAEEIVSEVLRDKVFYEISGGGVTISGGEPLFRPQFTAELLKRCKENGLHTAIETSGFATKKVLEYVLQNCDLVLYDIKETDGERHMQYTGVPLAPILENLKRIDQMEVPYILRLPIIPGLNDREEHFAKVRELVSGMAHCCGVEVMPYHKLGESKYEQLGRAYLCAHIEEPNKDQKEKWNQWCKELSSSIGKYQ